MAFLYLGMMTDQSSDKTFNNLGDSNPSSILGNLKRKKEKTVTGKDNISKNFDTLYNRLVEQEKRTKEIDELIRVIYIVIVITSLGTSIAFFSMIIEFFQFITK